MNHGILKHGMNGYQEIKEKTQRKGKDLFMPIRLALTGKTNGPELNKLILLMGYNKVMERLKRR